MPTIPIIQAKEKPTQAYPNVMPDVQGSGAVGQAVSKVGAAGLGFSEDMSNLILWNVEKMRRQDNAFAILKVQNGLSDDLRTTRDEYSNELRSQTENDPASVGEWSKKKIDTFESNLRTKYLTGVEDQQRSRSIEHYILGAVNSLKDHAAVSLDASRKEFMNAEATKAVDQAVNMTRDYGATPESMIEALREKFDPLVSSGAVSKAGADTFLKTASQKVVTSYLDSLMFKDPVKFSSLIKSGTYNQFIQEDDFRRFENAAKVADKDALESFAYREIAKEAGNDYKKAQEIALHPDTMSKYGLNLNQQQNIAQSFNGLYAASERQKKDMQDKNIGEIYNLATTNPQAALKKAIQMASTNPDAYDAKDLMQFKNSIETHNRQLSLMSQQEKQIRTDLEDKAKATIKQNILQGLYTDEKKLMSDIMAAGFSNTNEFMTQAVKLMRDERQNFGEVNQLKLAGSDWDHIISMTKDKDKKKELSDQKSQVMQTLTNWMQSNGVKTSDPKVYEKYKEIKDSVTSTWFTRALNGASDIFTGGKTPSGLDTLVKPAKEAAPVYPVGTERRNIKTNERQRWDGKQWVQIGS